MLETISGRCHRHGASARVVADVHLLGDWWPGGHGADVIGRESQLSVSTKQPSNWSNDRGGRQVMAWVSSAATMACDDRPLRPMVAG